MPRAEFAKCTKIANQPDAPRGSSECILSYFAASKEDVDAILKRANAAGGAVPGEAEDQPWGYSGYFTDPDGHLWEIMWKPALVGDATQANRKHGVAPEVGAISFMRVLPGPIERVWAYLTEPEKREKWFASGPMEFRASGRVRRFSVPPEPVFDASSFPIKLRTWRSPHHRKTKMHLTV
jgi:Glyoxalase/Bleomycin resistance protein/Dioxygenase superfamily